MQATVHFCCMNIQSVMKLLVKIPYSFESLSRLGFVLHRSVATGDAWRAVAPPPHRHGDF